MKPAPDRQRGVVYTASRLVAGAGATFSPGAVAVVDGKNRITSVKRKVESESRRPRVAAAI